MNRQRFCIDPHISLTPQEMEKLFEHPVMNAIAQVTLENPGYAEEAVDACINIMNALRGYSMVACVMGCIDMLGILKSDSENKKDRFEKRKIKTS